MPALSPFLSPLLLHCVLRHCVVCKETGYGVVKFTDCHGEIVSTYKRLRILAALTYPWSNISFTSRSAGVTTLPSRAQQCFKNWLCLYQSMILCTCVSIPVISHHHCCVFVSPTFPVIPTSPTKPDISINDQNYSAVPPQCLVSFQARYPSAMRSAQHRSHSTLLNVSPGQIDDQDSRTTYNLSL